VEIVKKEPRAAAPIIKLGLTALLQKYGVEPDAIDMNKYKEEVKPLHEYLNNGLTPMKFGVVDLLAGIKAIKAKEKKTWDAYKKIQKKADEEYKKEKEAYYNKLYNMKPKVL
jgi:hypothetical protein